MWYTPETKPVQLWNETGTGSSYQAQYCTVLFPKQKQDLPSPDD